MEFRPAAAFAGLSFYRARAAQRLIALTYRKMPPRPGYSGEGNPLSIKMTIEIETVQITLGTGNVMFVLWVIWTLLRKPQRPLKRKK